MAHLLKIDLKRHDVFVAGKKIDLTPKEFKVLAALVKANGRPLTRTNLLDAGWPENDYNEIDTRTVDQHVARLRIALGKAAGSIKTLTGVGYKAVDFDLVGHEPVYAIIKSIDRTFEPKVGATFQAFVQGNLVQELKVGSKIPVA